MKDNVLFIINQCQVWLSSSSPAKAKYYHKLSNISYTKSQNWNFLISSCSCLHAIYWSRVLSQERRCSLISLDRRCSNYIWVINDWIINKGATYIRRLMIRCFKFSLRPANIWAEVLNSVYTYLVNTVLEGFLIFTLPILFGIFQSKTKFCGYFCGL